MRCSQKRSSSENIAVVLVSRCISTRWSLCWNQWDAIRFRCNQVPPGAIRCNQVPPGVIRCHQVKSGAIRCNQVQSGAIRCNQVQVQSGELAIRGHQVHSSSVHLKRAHSALHFTENPHFFLFSHWSNMSSSLSGDFPAQFLIPHSPHSLRNITDKERGKNKFLKKAFRLIRRLNLTQGLISKRFSRTLRQAIAIIQNCVKLSFCSLSYFLFTWGLWFLGSVVVS